jgi:RimJ/RimL family protein N-acetyltransferase
MIEFPIEKDLEKIAECIGILNSQNEHHCGYVGTNKDEILHAFSNEFSDLSLGESVVCAYENGELIGVLGFDYDKETDVAEVWGPFVRHKDGMNVSFAMWEQLLKQLTVKPKKVYGFYNVHNKLGFSLMEKLQAERKDDQSILTIRPEDYRAKEYRGFTIREISSDDREAFKSLHNDTFKNTYYNAETLLEKQSDVNKIFVASQDNTFFGYVYCEADSEFGEGDIHYLAVSPEARKRGIGKQLIHESLEFLFSFNKINEINLCVESNNAEAIRTYKRAGFREKHNMILFLVNM